MDSQRVRECAVLPVRRRAYDDADSQLESNLLQEMRFADKHAQAYALLLAAHNWHWFGTFTFKPTATNASGGMHPEKADKCYRVLISKINREIYGTRWYRRPETQLVWARGQEFHKSGRIHFHAVLADPNNDLNTLTRRMRWVDWWYENFGIARIDKPQSQDDICSYVSKYVSKDGEVDVSPNFGKVVSPSLHFGHLAPPSRISKTTAPDGDAMRLSGYRSGQAVLASRCLTLPIRSEFGYSTSPINRERERNDHGEDYD